VEIEFEGTVYTWNEDEPLKGSNWEDTDGTTLVSVMAAAYDADPGPLTVTVSDGWHFLDVTFVLVLEDPSEPYDLTVTYTEANENIFVSFKVDGELDLQPIGGLEDPEEDESVIANLYNDLALAIASEDEEDIKDAALAIGDDIFIEYFYMDGENKMYLKTINDNDLVKNKYWNRFLVRDGDNERFPDWAEGETIIVVDTLHRTNTNPGTGSVAEGWLDEAKGKDVYIAVTVLNYGGVNTIVETVSIPDPVPDGIQISTWHDLDDVRNNPEEDYVLVNNLDSSTDGYEDLASSSANDGKGWEPIEPGFQGTFDGNGYTISDLYINRPADDRVGLFGKINSGTLKNISLESVDVTGHSQVGGLVGQAVSNSLIINCSSGGVVEGLAVTGAIQSTGGLVGWAEANTQIIDSHSTANVNPTVNATQIQRAGGLLGLHFGGGTDGAIIRSWASGDVSGHEYIGGLVGEIFPSVEVRESFATGNVIHTPAGTGMNGGGLIGLSQGKIENCYATGDVTGVMNVGGLVGSAPATNEVVNSYSTGKVTGTVAFTVGGFMGGFPGSGGTVISSYWDTETSEQTTSIAGEGKTTTEMKQQATFVGWDFSDIWTIEEDVSYLTLQWE